MESALCVARYLLCGIALFACAVLFADSKAAGSKLDAKRLKTGRFLYRTLVNGKDAGNSEISIRKAPGSGNFIYSNLVTGEFSQQWEAVATRSFQPISAKLTFGEGDKRRPAFELKYQDGRATGFAMTRQRSEERVKVSVDTEVPADTVDQRIDWAAAMTQDLVAGREFAFHVFDPGTGVSRVTGRVAGPEMVKVPAGAFEGVRILYRIEKAGGAEVYQVLTNRSGRRMMLREEFPNGAVTELVRVSE